MADNESGRHRAGTGLLAVVALVWAGMTLGVSGLATPVKFTAPSLTLPVALDVGRVTFHLLGEVEWGFAIAVVLAGIAAQMRWLWLPAGIVVAIVVAQALWLLPALDVRALTVIAGGTPPESGLHTWYIAAEAIKLAMLLVVGIGALRLNGKRKAPMTAG